MKIPCGGRLPSGGETFDEGVDDRGHGGGVLDVQPVRHPGNQGHLHVTVVEVVITGIRGGDVR